MNDYQLLDTLVLISNVYKVVIVHLLNKKVGHKGGFLAGHIKVISLSQKRWFLNLLNRDELPRS
ncbi:MAG: hypothetical protein MUF28_01715 [Ignavibacterium sp.]|nr:hypothetical protein [Ignavibacterium sp.]